MGLRHSAALSRAKGGSLSVVRTSPGACFDLRWPIAELRTSTSPRKVKRPTVMGALRAPRLLFSTPLTVDAVFERVAVRCSQILGAMPLDVSKSTFAANKAHRSRDAKHGRWKQRRWRPTFQMLRTAQ